METKIHLSSQYDNLDLEKIMDSQYPALQLVPLSGVTNGIIDRTKLSEEEYITPVLGTLTVHGITENKPDLDNIDLEEMAMTENKTGTLESESEPHSTLLHTQQDDTSSPKTLDSPVTEAGNRVTNNLVQDPAQTLQQPNIDSTAELHGITNDSQPVVCEDKLISEATDPTFTKNTQVGTDTVEVNNAPMNSTQTPNIDNSSKLKGVMTTDDILSATQHKTDTAGVNGVMKTPTQSSSEQNEPETLPDLVLNENSAVNKVNTTEDEDEAAEALLQLSKSDILPEEDTELPLGVLTVDAAIVLITLGNQDVLNAIENFKQNNGETGTGSNKNDDPKTPEDAKRDNNEKENKNKDKKDNTEPQFTPESSPLTSPAKGNLVIIKHGIRRKKSMGRTYKCARCNKRKSSTWELNKHYRLKHKPLMCGICNKLFDLPGTL